MRNTETVSNPGFICFLDNFYKKGAFFGDNILVAVLTKP